MGKSNIDNKIQDLVNFICIIIILLTLILIF
jgi:hypothetical protein